MNIIKHWKEIYVRETYYFNCGLGQLGAFKTLITVLLGAQVYLKIIFDTDLSFNYIIIGGIISVIGLRTFGWLWDKAHLYMESQEFSNRRNLFVLEMRKKMKIKTFKH